MWAALVVRLACCCIALQCEAVKVDCARGDLLALDRGGGALRWRRRGIDARPASEDAPAHLDRQVRPPPTRRVSGCSPVQHEITVDAVGASVDLSPLSRALWQRCALHSTIARTFGLLRKSCGRSCGARTIGTAATMRRMPSRRRCLMMVMVLVMRKVKLFRGNGPRCFCQIVGSRRTASDFD